MNPLFSYIQKKVYILWRYKIQALIVRILNIILPSKLVDAIVIESHDDFDSNGGALYEYLINNQYNKRYTIVVFLHHKLDRPLPNGVKAYRISRPGIPRAYYSCRAKYLFAEDSLHKKMKRKQVSVYLSHGIPIKNTRGIIKLLPSIDYCLSPSVWFDPYIRKAFTMDDTDIKMFHLGYPRLDVLYNASESELSKLTSKTFKKKILWMPTFRKGGGKDRNDADYDLPLGVPLLYTEEEAINLNEFLVARDMLLVIKIHPKQDLSTVKIKSLSNMIVLMPENVKEKDISNYRLYKDMDAMVSDYSSASFDFMNLDRPICYDFSDLEHYKLGLIMNNFDDFLPGEKIYNIDGLLRFLDDVSNGVDSNSKKRKEVLNKLFEYRDGNSCERIVKFLGI